MKNALIKIILMSYETGVVIRVVLNDGTTVVIDSSVPRLDLLKLLPKCRSIFH